MQASTTNAARARRPRSAPKPRGKGSSGAWPPGEDWLYGQALTYVRRQRCTNVADLARELGVMHVTAKSILARMQADGVVGEPDLLGQQRLVEGGRDE